MTAPEADPRFPTEILELFQFYIGHNVVEFSDLVAWFCRQTPNDSVDPDQVQETIAAHSRLILCDQIIQVGFDKTGLVFSGILFYFY